MLQPIHPSPSPLAGKSVSLHNHVPVFGGHQVKIADWYDRVAGRSWKLYNSLNRPDEVGAYAIRAGSKGYPLDDEVLLGHIVKAGQPSLVVVVHISELNLDGLGEDVPPKTQQAAA